MKFTKLKSTIVVGMLGLVIGAAGCGESEDDTTTNPITTGGQGGSAGVAGVGGTTGGAGGTAGTAAGTGGVSGMAGASGMTGGMAGTSGQGGTGGTGGAGGMTGGTGGTGGMTGGTGGMTGGTTGGTGGTSGMGPTDPVIAECVANHYDGVDATCAECMCECTPLASECDELCWQLSLCTYRHCQMSTPPNQGEASQQDCVVNYCGIYLGPDLGMAATNITATGCFGPSECGITCAAFWAMDIESGPQMAQ